MQRNRRQPDAGVDIRILRGEPVADGPHFGDHLLERHTRLRPADTGQVPVGPLAGGEVLRIFQRRPQGPCRRIRESPGHHADDLDRHSVEHDRPSDDLRVAAETLLPQPVTEDGNLVPAWQIFLRAERTAQRVAGHQGG